VRGVVQRVRKWRDWPGRGWPGLGCVLRASVAAACVCRGLYVNDDAFRRGSVSNGKQGAAAGSVKMCTCGDVEGRTEENKRAR